MGAYKILSVQNFHFNSFEVFRINADVLEMLTALTNYVYSIDFIYVLSLHLFNWDIPLPVSSIKLFS